MTSASWYQRLVSLWEATQVELHGTYSADRLLCLATSTRETSWLRVLAIVLLTPVPCLLLTVIIDILPLSNPVEGLHANYVFVFREFYTYLMFTFLAKNQFRYTIR